MIRTVSTLLGVVTLGVSLTGTVAPARAGSYDYDIILLRGTEAIRAAEGVVTVKQGVTR